MEPDNTKEVLLGTCTEWDKKQHFGFIRPDNDFSGLRVFCNVIALTHGAKSLAIGKAVRYTAHYDSWTRYYECTWCRQVGTWRRDAIKKRGCTPWHEKREVCTGPGDGVQLEGTATWVQADGNYAFLAINVTDLRNDEIAKLWTPDEGKGSTLITVAHIGSYIGLQEQPVTLAKGDVVCFTLGYCWHLTKKKLQRWCPAWCFQREVAGVAMLNAKRSTEVASAEATGALEHNMPPHWSRWPKDWQDWPEEPEAVDERVPKTPEESEFADNRVPKTSRGRLPKKEAKAAAMAVRRHRQEQRRDVS